MSTTGGADSAAAETVSGPANKTPSWRDHLPIHPAADLFPLMSESELRELGEDIKANGLFSPIVIADEMVLDGRNRLDAMELVGIKFEFIRDHKGKIIRLGGNYLAIHCGNVCGGVTQAHQWWDNPYDFVLAANLHRRHLTADQKRDLIVKVLKAKPEESNRQIAKQVKADDKTVASVRRDLESTAEIPQLKKTTGTDGKQRKTRAKNAPEPKPPVTHHLAAESPEVSIEQRRREHGRLDRVDGADTAADEGDIVDRTLALVHVMTNSERQRFFAEYQIRFPKTMNSTNAAD